MPGAFELVYDNYNFLVFGFCATERASSAICSLACDRNGTTLMFWWGSRLPDPQELLQGGGKQNRFVRLPSAATLREPGVAALLDAAIVYSEIPLAAQGGRTIVKLISPTQRPRR